MPQYQHQGAGIVIDDGSGLRATQKRESVFEVRGAAAASALGEPIFKIVVLHSNSRNRFHDHAAKGRPAKIRVYQNSGGIDHRLQAGCADNGQGRTQARKNVLVRRNRFVFAQRGQFAPDGGNNHRERKLRVAESLRKFVDGWDIAKSRTLHANTLIPGFFDRTIFPMITAHNACCRFKSSNTVSRFRSGTLNRSPPLVCASVSRIFCSGVALPHSVKLAAYSRLSRLPPGTHPPAMNCKTSAPITGTAPAEISAATPLARHMAARCPSKPNPVISTAALRSPRSASSAPTLLSLLITATTFRCSERLARSRLMAVVMIPVPRGFVRTRTSPARALALVSMWRGDTRPVTASP